MARSYTSYDEDWQRRKAVPIRSLFHDIPILSPVTEESNDSSQNNSVSNEEVFHSPPRPYSPLPPLIIEEVSVANKHDEPEEYYSKLCKKMKRVYKKLFIENRNPSSVDSGSNYSNSSNDDRENIGDVSDESLDFRFLENNYPDKGNFDSVIEDREPRQSSASSKSNGYGADFESTDTVIIDVVNYTPSNTDGITISDEEESDNESRDEDPRSSSRPSENEEISRDEESNENEESSRGRIDDPEFMGREKSHHSEDEESSQKESSSNENIKEHKTPETNQIAESGTDSEFSEEEPYYSSIDDDEKAKSKESNETEEKQQPNNVTKRKQDLFGSKFGAKEFETQSFSESSSSEGPTYRQITTAAMVHFDGSPDAVERESQVYEDSVKSPILSSTRFRRVVVRRNVSVDDIRETFSVLDKNADSKTTSSFNTNEREIGSARLAGRGRESKEMDIPIPETTRDNVKEAGAPRLDGPEEDDEKITTPQPEFADKDVEGMESPQPVATNEETEDIGIPLPKVTEEDIEELDTPRLDGLEQDDEEMSTEPDSDEEDVEGMGPPPIEQMRTPRADSSHGTITATHRSYSESTSENTAVQQEHKSLTPSTQDGGDHNMSELQTSNDINEILTSIINESHKKQHATPISERKRKYVDKSVQTVQTSRVTWEEMRGNFFQHATPISERKRKYVDKSVQTVQTSRVTWEEMRGNFFVGTPKIFRLCACADHIC